MFEKVKKIKERIVEEIEIARVNRAIKNIEPLTEEESKRLRESLFKQIDEYENSKNGNN